MKFSAGDIIVIRRSGEEGHIVGFIGQDMAEIEVGGTVFPVYLDEIDHPYLRWFTEKNKKKTTKPVAREQIPVEQTAERPPRQHSGVHLVFMPEYGMTDMEERVQRLKLFLANETGYTIKMKYEVRIREELVFSHETTLQPFSDLYLHYLDWEQMNEVPRFSWTLQEQQDPRLAVATDTLKIRPAKLFAQLHALQQDNRPSFSYTLLEDFAPAADPQPVLQTGNIIPVIRKRVQSVKDIPRYELDLHIEQLTDDPAGMSNAEILEWQLSALKKHLDLAIRHMQDRLVVIHGIGKGTLKSEVHRVLKQYDTLLHFESGWQPGYGYGATVVYFRY